MSSKLEFMLLLLIGFIAIIIVLFFENSLLLTITVLMGMFTLELMVLYNKELFGRKKEK